MADDHGRRSSSVRSDPVAIDLTLAPAGNTTPSTMTTVCSPLSRSSSSSGTSGKITSPQSCIERDSTNNWCLGAKQARSDSHVPSAPPTSTL
jgi:hypothetical protein